MTRTFIIFIFLALIALAILPHPVNPTTADWGNIQHFKTSSPSLLEIGLAAIGVTAPKKWLPGAALICLSLLLSFMERFLNQALKPPL